jgi:hypothetical protein
MNSEKIYEFAWSSVTTFVATFLLTVAPLIGNAPMEQGFWLALIMTGGRAGVKAVMQLLLNNKVGEMFGAKGRV